MVTCWHLFAMVQLLMLHQASCSPGRDFPPQAKGRKFDLTNGDPGVLPEKSAGIGYAYGRGGGVGKGWGLSHHFGGSQDVCGELFLYNASVPTVTYGGETCTTAEGVMPHAGCFGGCTSEEVTGTEYWPNDYNVPPVNNCTCCAPSCYNKSEMTIQCSTEQTFFYFVPTQCQCSLCSEVSEPNILKVRSYDDWLEVYFDGVRQIPLNGLQTELSWTSVSHYFLDQCNLPTQITLYTFDNWDDINMFVAVDGMGLITDSTWQCYHDSDPPTAATEVVTTTIDGINAFWISVSDTLGPPPGTSTTCTKVL